MKILYRSSLKVGYINHKWKDKIKLQSCVEIVDKNTIFNI